MNLSYMNTIEDYVEANKITRNINPVLKFFEKILPCFVYPIAGVVLFWDVKSNGGTFDELSFIVIADIGFTLFFWLGLSKMIDRRQEKQIHSNSKLIKDISAERKIILTEDKLLLLIKDRKVELKLEEIGYVTEYNDKIFIITRLKTVVAMIPNTTFNSYISKDEFINKIMKKAKKNKVFLKKN